MELMPAAPLLRLRLEFDGVLLPAIDGSSFTKSARFGWPDAARSSAPITVTGVGVS